jgi:DNA-binding MarR family transcriptional regulator
MLRLHGAFRTALDSLSLTPLQAGVLLYVYRNPGAGIFEAAKSLGIKPPTLTPVVQDLVRRRYVSRREDQADRRGRRLALTSQGQAMVPCITKRITTIKYEGV